MEIALRRMQKYSEDDSKVLFYLETILKHCESPSPYLTRRKLLFKMVEVIDMHQESRPILSLATKIFIETLRSPVERNEDGKLFRNIFEGILQIEQLFTDILKKHDKDQEVQENTIELFAMLCNTSLEFPNAKDEIRDVFFNSGLLFFVAIAMHRFTSNELLCDAGTFIIYWFYCFNDREIQKHISREPLDIAIDATIKQYKKDTGQKLSTKDPEQLQEILKYPELKKAIDEDPVFGAVCKAYALHKDTCKNIADEGLELQFGVIERQRELAKHFSCSYCEKHLSKSEGQIGSCCRQVIYCSRYCQKKHWKKTHRENCTSK